MNDLGELKQELQEFMDLAHRQGEENRLLRLRVAELEGEKSDLESQQMQLQLHLQSQMGGSVSSTSSSNSIAASGGNGVDPSAVIRIEEFNQAKLEWKKQAIDYGEMQCQLAFDEFDKEIKKYYSILAYDQAVNQEDEWPLCGQLLTRYILNESHYLAERKVYKAIYRTHCTQTIQVMDFDIQDCHIKIQNNSKYNIQLKNYFILFHESGCKMTFDGGVINSGQYMSVWWGVQPAWRNSPEQGSIVSNIGPVAFKDFERAEIFSHKQAQAHKTHGISTVFSNQHSLFTEDENEFSSLDLHSQPNATKPPIENVKSPKKGKSDKSPKKSANSNAATSSSSSSSSEGPKFPGMDNESNHHFINISKYLKKRSCPYFLDGPRPLLLERKSGCIELSTRYVPATMIEEPAPVTTRVSAHSSSASMVNSESRPLSPKRKRNKDGELKSLSSSSSSTQIPLVLIEQHSNLDEPFEENRMVTTVVDEVFYIIIHNHSKSRVFLGNWRLRIFSSPLTDLELPSNVSIDPNGCLILTSRYNTNDDYDSIVNNNKRSASAESNSGDSSSSSSSSSRRSSKENVLEIPELHNIFSIGLPPRSLHLIDTSGPNALHCCEFLESEVLRGVFPSKKIITDDKFAREVLQATDADTRADEGSYERTGRAFEKDSNSCNVM